MKYSINIKGPVMTSHNLSTRGKYSSSQFKILDYDLASKTHSSFKILLLSEHKENVTFDGSNGSNVTLPTNRFSGLMGKH